MPYELVSITDLYPNDAVLIDPDTADLVHGDDDADWQRVVDVSATSLVLAGHRDDHWITNVVPGTVIARRTSAYDGSPVPYHG